MDLPVASAVLKRKKMASIVAKFTQHWQEVFQIVKRRVDSIVLSPAYAAVLVVLTITAGLFGSVYGHEVLTAFPFRKPGMNWSQSAIHFWSVALAAALLYLRRQRLVDRTRIRTIGSFQRHAEELRSTSEQLARLIRTMPPAQFLDSYHLVYQRVSELVEQATSLPVEKRNPAELRKAIRAALDCVATLAHQFDGGERGVYGANLMLYVPSEALTEKDAVRLNPMLLFSEPGSDVRQLRGVLLLDRSLSTATDVSGPEIDPYLQSFALPIPRPSSEWSGTRRKVLPGAPEAFFKGINGFVGYPDTHTIAKHCRATCDFSDTVFRGLERYFGQDQGDRVRSFVSLCFARPGAEEACGVMNIHRNLPNVLRVQEAAEHFGVLIRSINGRIVQLVDLLLESTGGGPVGMLFAEDHPPFQETEQ